MNINNIVRCAQICVDCVANDPVDIRCGGPEYLGFDFFVREEQAEEMKDFVLATLQNFMVPLKEIYISGSLPLDEEHVWDEKRIFEVIGAEAEYLQGEAERNYDSSSFGK